MNLYILIVTHAREALLRRTLSCLAACTIPSALRATIVVENGARGGAEAVIRDASPSLKLRYLFEQSTSKCRSLNAGIDAIDDDGLVLFLDDDVLVVPDLLERYVAAAHEFGPGHFLGGPVAADYEEPPPAWLIPFLPNSAKGWHLEDSSELLSVPRFLGFNWAVFARDLRDVGGFNEDLGPGSWTASVGDESDMQRRLMRAGVTAKYVPGALVRHWVPKTHCSPAFALQRAYRDGIRIGFLYEEEWRLVVRGYPLGLIRRTAEAWIAARYQRLVAGEMASFPAEVMHLRRRGALKGISLRRRQDRMRKHDSPARTAFR